MQAGAAAVRHGSMAEAEEEVAFDERFEFDAPQFYDFDEGSPPEKAPADGWFDTDGPKGEGRTFQAISDA